MMQDVCDHFIQSQILLTDKMSVNITKNQRRQKFNLRCILFDVHTLYLQRNLVRVELVKVYC